MISLLISDVASVIDNTPRAKVTSDRKEMNQCLDDPLTWQGKLAIT